MRTVYLFCLTLIWTYPKDCQLFEVQTVEVCYGNTFSSYVNLECGEAEVIQVRNTQAVAKLVSTGCPIELTTFNEKTVPENCCITEPEDCGVLYTGSVYQDYYKRCHGNQVCRSLQASWVDITDTGCNQTLYLPRTNYMVFTFRCIPKNFIKSPCEGIQTTNNSVYIWNSGYPAEMAPGVDSCTCAAEIDCNSTILIRAIDLRLQDDVSGTCLQEILVTDGDSQFHITCSSNNAFLETTIYSSTSDFITIEIMNTMPENGGIFWIEVYGKDEDAKITLSCGPSVIGQAEIRNKTTCGPLTTTTSTSTTITSTGHSNKSITNLISTLPNYSLSAPTSSISTTPETANYTSSTPISSARAVNYTTEYTPFPLNSTKNPDSSSSTTSNSSTASVTAKSSLTSVTSDSTFSYAWLSTSSVTITNFDPSATATDHESTKRSPLSDPDSAAINNVSDGGSSSPLGIIIAVVVVLVLLFIILAVLLFKRKQIKRYFCPSKIEDKEDVEETETPEYDTMPNPLLTEGTLPLITGTAAASTVYPTLPGGGFIGKKTTLEPISSPPPIPKGVLNLSSSLHYKLPKIENIKSSIRRERSTIADELVEENTRNPFPNIRKFEVEKSTTQETISETNNEMNHGNSDLTASKKEKKLRKKRKRMIDRLNRIKTPMHARNQSVMGFGSSTTRF